MASLQPLSKPGSSLRLLEMTNCYAAARGDGAGSGGDDDAASRFVPPSFDEPGDLGDFDDKDELLLKPQWADDFE